jgi:hypothetical protein
VYEGALAFCPRAARLGLFAVGLLVAGAATGEASTITCGYGGAASGSQCISFNGGTGGFFDFDPQPYTFQLEFEQVNGEFTVDVQDLIVTQASLLSDNRLNGFPGYTCVPIADNSTNCVDFHVTAPAPGPSTWEGFYDVFIFWFDNTEGGFPNDPVDPNDLGRIRVLHNLGSVDGNAFDTDITIPGSYIPFYECGECVPDPGIGGRDNSFQSFTVAQAPTIPEPGTLFLIGGGTAILIVKGRSKKQAVGA